MYYTTYAGYQFYSQLKEPIGVVQTPNGIFYQIKQNFTPTAAGSTAFYINPSELQKQDSYGAHTHDIQHNKQTIWQTII